MTATKILISKLIAITCIASFILAFSACKKDDIQLKIKIIDIPAEYNGMTGGISLRNDNCNEGIIGSGGGTITNGKVTIKISDARYCSWNLPSFTEKGEYYVRFQISESIFNTILSVRSDGKINITKETTTISFRTLEIEEPS